jgi:hypothetical protein
MYVSKDFAIVSCMLWNCKKNPHSTTTRKNTFGSRPLWGPPPQGQWFDPLASQLTIFFLSEINILKGVIQ